MRRCLTLRQPLLFGLQRANAQKASQMSPIRIDSFQFHLTSFKQPLMDTATIETETEPSSLNDGMEATRYRIADKWQGAVGEGSGWVAIPMSLLRLQTHFKLTPTDMVVLTNLLAHWWDPARAVFPRSSTIAKRMGVTKRTVQRSTQKMIISGLMEREHLENGRRAFRFDALVASLAKDIALSRQRQGRESLGA